MFKKMAIGLILAVLVVSFSGMAFADFYSSFSPVAQFRCEAIGSRTILFDASCSQGRDLEYDWNFGDGDWEITTHPQVSHKYWFPGEYLVTLKVTDKWGWSHWTERVIEVPWLTRPTAGMVIRAHIDLGELPLEGLATMIAYGLILTALMAFSGNSIFW